MPLPPDLAPGQLLTDDEVAEIRSGLEGGVHGPVVLKWVRLLLADRDERERRIRDAR